MYWTRYQFSLFKRDLLATLYYILYLYVVFAKLNLPD